MRCFTTVDPAKTSRFRRNLTAAGICIALAAITWTVFGRTVGHEFVNYDDPSYVTAEPNVAGGLSWPGVVWAFTKTHSGNWHPVTTLTHMLDWQLYGLNAAGHHRSNVLLHTAAVVFLFLALRQMTGAAWRSALVAAVFAIHPLRVESVAWVAERKDVLSGVFFALTLAAYTRYVRKRSVTSYVVLAFAFALGLMSKSTLVTLPFLLLLLDDWPLRRGVGIVRLFPEKIPLLLMSAATCVLTYIVHAQTMSSVQTVPLLARLTNACVSVVTYVGQMFWPAKLAAFYPHAGDQLPLWQGVAAAALIVMITLAIVAIPRVPAYVPIGWLWYLGMLVPVIGIVQVGLPARADRYTYLPQIGLYVLIVWGIADLTRRWRFQRQVMAIAGAGIVGLLAWGAVLQTGHWRNSESLWRRALAVTANNAVAHTNLGNLLPGRDAVPHYEQALATEPGATVTMNNLAWVLATHPDLGVRNGPRAVELAANAARMTGGSDPVYLRTLAAAYAEVGSFRDAVRIATAAVPLAEAAGNEALAFDLRNNIAGYERGFPMRDSSMGE